MKSIGLDINCDLGEGLPNDLDLMPLLDSCNIACGGHAGNEHTMSKAIKSAIANGVKVGAHPSFPDKVNFGREIMRIESSKLADSLILQIESFQAIATKFGVHMHHIKPHGALYNLSAQNRPIADLISEIILKKYPGTLLYCPPNSASEKSALERGIGIRREVFADRNYANDYSLIPRSKPNAMINSEIDAAAQVREIVIHKRIKTLDGHFLPVTAETICVHGDHPNAIGILKSIHPIVHHEATQHIQGT